MMIMKMNALRTMPVLYPRAPMSGLLSTKTKSCSSVASRVSVPSYKMYETPQSAVCCFARSSKWGMIAAIWNDPHTNSSILLIS
jgi:hypothetical protein